MGNLKPLKICILAHKPLWIELKFFSVLRHVTVLSVYVKFVIYPVQQSILC